MKIAILSSEYITENNWHGGLANYLSRVTVGLIDRGHKVHLLVYSDRQEVVEVDGVVIHRIDFRNFYLNILNKVSFNLAPGFFQILYVAYKFKKYFIKINKKEKFDLIHASSCHAPSLFLNSKKLKIPIITRMSSISSYCQLAYNRKNFIDIYLMDLCEKYLVRRSTAVFAPSKMVVDLIKKDFKVPATMIESPGYFKKKMIFDNSVYNKFFKDKKYLLFYGTLGRLKGAEYIANFIYSFLRNNKNVYFAMIGKMRLLKKGVLPIEPIIKNAGQYKNRIIYMDSLPHSKLFPIIKKSCAVVLPSIVDNLPNACIESMGLGKIVIGTYDGGFDQIIDNEKNGFLVKYGDVAGIKKIFNKICHYSAKDLKRIEVAAKNTIIQRLNYDNKIIELEKYYKNVIKNFKEKYK